VVDYKALTGLSLLRIPHFRTRHGAKLKDLNPNTTVGKALELRGARVFYRVRQITHRAITTNKRDQVIVTMHASKLKTKQEQSI
jgi:hypothetical protein